MKNYQLNIENANAEVLKWLDDTANKRIHQTTLQIPMELLVEQPHLLSDLNHMQGSIQRL